MSYYVEKLSRPYDMNVLIQAYIYTQQKDFVHHDFNKYYRSLHEELEQIFGVDMSGRTLSFDQRCLMGLFDSTVRSLHQIRSPWSGYLEASLLHAQLKKHEDINVKVKEASNTIVNANSISSRAHRDMLHALFCAVFGELQQVVTSDDLRARGFDDSTEPDISNYYGYM